MFKVGKLKDIDNVEIKIDSIVHTSYDVIENTNISFNTLLFDIYNNIYSFTFSLNCKPEELLNIEEGKTIDFKKYLFKGETMFTYNGITDLEPKYDITINRYMNNKYVILANIFSDINTNTDSDIYSSVIEFDFNLDDYI